jgi:acetoin utilization deacetylase AcuC-like enzyme
LNLTERAFTSLSERLKQQALESAEGRLVSILEGGYELEALSLCVSEHLKVLSSD